MFNFYVVLAGQDKVSDAGRSTKRSNQIKIIGTLQNKN